MRFSECIRTKKAKNLSETNLFMLGLAALALIYHALSVTGKFARARYTLLVFIFVYLFIGLVLLRILG